MISYHWPMQSNTASLSGKATTSPRATMQATRITLERWRCGRLVDSMVTGILGMDGLPPSLRGTWQIVPVRPHCDSLATEDDCHSKDSGTNQHHEHAGKYEQDERNHDLD